MADFFNNIIDVPSLRSLMESMQQATGIPARLLDHEGQTLVEPSWPTVCSSHNRKHSNTAQNCHQSDLFFAGYLQENDLPAEGFIKHTCQNGLVEIGLPIVINGFHSATLLFGQFLPEQIDLDFFKSLAAGNGINEQEYIKAIIKIWVVY